MESPQPGRQAAARGAKIPPKLLHLQRGGTDLAGYGMTCATLTRQRAGIARYAGEFTGLLALSDEMARRTVTALAAATLARRHPGTGVT